MAYTNIIEINLSVTATWENTEADTITMILPDGISARLLSGDIGDWKKDSIEIPAADSVVFLAGEFVPPVSYGKYAVSENDSVVVKFVNSKYKNCIVLEDFCYGDFFEADSETMQVFKTFDDSADLYVYDKQSEIFRENAAGESGGYTVTNHYDIPMQTNSEQIDAYFDSADIVFADYAVGDNQVDTWLNANVSVAGLYMTFAQGTDADFEPTSTRIQLGRNDMSGTWNNEVYCGKTVIESKQIQPDSHDSKAIRFRFKVDFNNNGKDDIEIQSLNILSTLKIFEKEG